ncbi:hypothetical protein HG530_015728 [Fusarium avenaceum]|nr:hypothetical protein HG530_015728 [Fusarium avenaceum]
MPTTYIAQIVESTADRKLLVTEGYSLLLKRSVDFGSGSASINFVYGSKDLAPHMKISWVASYGLNWSTDMSKPGAQVNYTGDWQQCDLGQSFTLTADGSWVASQNNLIANEDSLNVAANNYSKEVHIVVGVKTADGKWTPIWLAKDALLKIARQQTDDAELEVFGSRPRKIPSLMFGNATASNEAYYR